MTFVGPDEPDLAAEDRLPGYHDYFLGNDPARWRGEVPLYGAVCYRGLYPGIEVGIREENGQFEYDLLVDPDGALVLETGVGPVRMPVPLSWEEEPSGQRRQIPCR